MEAYIQLTGRTGTDVTLRKIKKPDREVSVADFRLATTPRRRQADGWIDGETTWFTVSCWSALAEHVARSVRKGDPVVVVGRFRTDAYDGPNGRVEKLAIEAVTIGHDLLHGTASFARAERAPTAVLSELDDSEWAEPSEGQAAEAASRVA